MNPIGYDKIVNDNVEKGFKTLITLLEEFNNVLKSGDKIYVETLNTLKLEIDGVNKSMEDLNVTAKKKNKHTDEEIQELLKLAGELEKLRADYDNLKNAQNQATQAQKQNKQTIEDNAGSIDNLSQSLKELQELQRENKKQMALNSQEIKAQKAILTELIATAKKNKDTTQETIDKIENQKNVIKSLIAEQDKLKLNTVDYSNELGRAKEKIKENNEETKKANAGAKKIAETLKQNANATKNLAGSYDELSNRNKELKRELKSMPDVFGANADAAKRLQTQIAANDKTLKDFDSSIGESFRNVGNYASAFDGLSGGLVGAFTAGGVAGLGFAAMEKGIELVISGVQKLAEEVDKANKELALTQSITGLTGDSLNEFTASIQATAKTFDVDYVEVLNAANAASKEFGISQKDAISGIQTLLASGGNINGDALDNIREYSTQVSQVGLSYKQFIELQTKSAKAGLFDDKLIDTIKEGALRLGDLTKSQKEALATLGKSGDEVTKLFSEGKKFEAIQKLSKEIVKLQENGQNAQPIISNLFGGAGEDVGKQGFKIIATLDATTVSLTKAEQATLDLVKAQTKSGTAFNEFASRFSGISTNFTIGLEKAKTAILEYVNNLFDKFSEIGLSIEKFFSLFGDDTSGKILQFFKDLIAFPFTNYAKYVDFVADSFKRFVSTIFGVSNAIKSFKVEFANSFQDLKDFATGDLSFVDLKAKIKKEGANVAKAFNEGYDKTLKELSAKKPTVTSEGVVPKTETTTTTPTTTATAAKTAKDKFKTNADYEKELAKLQIDLSKEVAKETEKQRPEFLIKTREEIEKIKKLLANPFDIAVTFKGEAPDISINQLENFEIQAEKLQQQKNLGIITEKQLQNDLLEIEKQKLQYKILQAEENGTSLLEIEKLKTQLTKLNATYYEPYSKLESLRSQRLNGIITEREYEDALLQDKIDNINKELAEKEKLKDFDNEYFKLKNDLRQIDVDKENKAFATVYDNYTNFVNKFVKDNDTKVLLNLLGSVVKGAFAVKKGDKSTKEGILDVLSGFSGFSDGGFTGSGGKYDPAGIVHKGEVVFSQENIKRLGGVGNVENIRNLNFDNVNLGKFYEPMKNIESKPLQVLQVPPIDIDSLAVAIGRNITNFDVKETVKHLIISQKSANLTNRIIVKKQNKAT